MATFTKRTGKRGTRWTARVRLRGKHPTDTVPTLEAAKAWARAQEAAIEIGVFHPSNPNGGSILADGIDNLRADRKRLRRAPGSTFDNALDRLKRELGLQPM